MNAQKTPISRTLPNFVGRKALDVVNTLGLALPGKVVSVSGPIVTIEFNVSWATLPQVTMPLASAEYIRWPIKAGDTGVAYPASAFLGAVTGLGGPTDDTTPGRLEALVWVPVGSKNWSTEGIDPDALTLYAPNGVVLRDADSETTFTLTPNGLVVNAQTSIEFQIGGSTMVTITSAGVNIQGREFLAHTHLPGLYEAPNGPVSGDSGAVV